MKVHRILVLSGLIVAGFVGGASVASAMPLKRTYPKKVVYIAFTGNEAQDRAASVDGEPLSENEKQVIARYTQRVKEIKSSEIEAD